ncbi:general secretion pathway protein I [Shimia sagamensis]|uniref:General secretion pathway protein I n=2 Tax=Shimia sagamensis TaxID=1566352 RepID=A0ABY1NBM6_9RHOB|nr:general secretion pathway protein I [Shimia sagamensis]
MPIRRLSGADMQVIRHQRSPEDSGLTLIELAIAIFVLAIGTIAATRTADQSRVAIGGETPRLLARIVAHNRIEERKLYGTSVPLPATVLMGAQDFAIEEDVAVTEAGLVRVQVTARGQSGEGAQLNAYLKGGL